MYLFIKNLYKQSSIIYYFSFSIFLKDINAIQGVKANEIEFIMNDGMSFSFGLQYPGFSPKNIQGKRDDIVSYIQGIINQQ